MDKVLFAEAIEKIKLQREKNVAISEAYSIAIPGTRPQNFLPNVSILEDALIYLVEKDSPKAGEGWTKFFIDELNFGDSKIDVFDCYNKRIQFKNADDLYNFLYAN